jgi:hypothetical protein
MSRHMFVFVGACVVVIAVVVLAPVDAAGQAAAASRPAVAAATGPQPRTAWGDPDLQGVWNYSTLTPLERPAALADKRELTPEEAAAFAEAEARRQNRDLIPSEKGGLNYAPESEGGVVPYNEFWYDRGTTIIASRRTSLVIDPPDGRRPPMTPEAQKKAAVAREIGREEQRGRPLADNPEDRGVGDRCITRLLPRLPGAYNNNYQIVQAPGYVVLLAEMNHDVRIIPVDGRPHLHRDVRQWLGDSRGRWEGNTLVVETVNFATNGDEDREAGPNVRLVERFTRVNGDTIEYEVTVNDPATWTRPWTAAFPLTKTQDRVYEYACHEGNYSLFTILRGARLSGQANATRGGSR